MIESKEIKINDSIFLAKRIKLCDNSTLLMISGNKGYIMCSYLNINFAQKRQDIACIVSGIKTIEDMLNANIVALTTKAQELGITMGMPVMEALKKLS